jgi:hypothetical protein
MSTSEDNPNPIPGTSPADLEQIHDARMTARQLAYVQMVGRAKALEEGTSEEHELNHDLAKDP